VRHAGRIRLVRLVNRVDRVIAHSVRPALLVASHQIRIDLFYIFSHQADTKKALTANPIRLAFNATAIMVKNGALD